MTAQHKGNTRSASFICVSVNLILCKTIYQQNLHNDCNSNSLINVGTSSKIVDKHEPSAGSSFLQVCSVCQHDTLTRYRFNFGPLFATQAQH